MRLLFIFTEDPFKPVNGISNKSYNVINSIPPTDEIEIVVIDNSKLCHYERGKGGYNLLKVVDARQSSVSLEKVIAAMKGYPYELYSRFQKPFRKYVQHLTRLDYDIIHIDLINLVLYASMFTKERIILSLNDPPTIISQSRYRNDPIGFSKLRHFISYAYDYGISNRYLNKYPNLHFVSEADKVLIQHFCESPIIIPVGVDTETPALPYREVSSNAFSILIMGDFRINWISQPSEQIISKIQRNLDKVFSLEITLLGKGSEEVHIRSTESVKVTCHTWIDNIHEYYMKHDLVIVPDRGGFGIKNRAIQGLLHGNICLIQKRASKGLRIKHMEHCYLYDDEMEVIDVIKSIQNMNTKQQELRENAIDYVLTDHSLETVGKAWQEQYEKMEDENAKTCSKSKIW